MTFCYEASKAVGSAEEDQWRAAVSEALLALARAAEHKACLVGDNALIRSVMDAAEATTIPTLGEVEIES